MTRLKLLPALLLCALCVLTSGLPLRAQTGAGTAEALFLSDVHFDPYTDPGLTRRLDASPASAWAGILAGPASPRQKADAVAVQTACPTRGADTSEALWQSTLRAIRVQTAAAPRPKFIVLTGDLQAHDFDCKYKFLFPAHTHAQFVAFAGKMLRFEFATLRAAAGGIPVYTALGNNDTTCGGNRLDPDNDFLAEASRIVAENLPAGSAGAGRDLAAGGFYAVDMAAPMEHTRMLVLDDIFFLTEYSTCAGKKDDSEETAQINWLKGQIAEARERHENVWVVGHVPPGVQIYTTIRRGINVCAGKAPWMEMDSTRLPEVLAANADVVRLALFAHTHFDEMALIRPGLGETPPPAGAPAGVPVKLIPSVSPINLNNPTFTLARIDPKTATLVDYTTYAASNGTGHDTTWRKEYTYGSAYGEPDFSAKSVSDLMDKFHADREASTAVSREYLKDFYAGDVSSLIAPFWPMYACMMDHQTGAGFAACACGKSAAPDAAAKP